MFNLGPFELRRVIGRGGMATVWEARHREHAALVAVKVIRRSLPDRELLAAAIRNEVRAAARLDHPAIVRMYDAGEVPADCGGNDGAHLEAGSPWFAMELVEGFSLTKFWALLGWPALHRCLMSILDALAHAHARGVLHRDIKPGNVLLADLDGSAKLTDFGLAHAFDRSDADDLDKAFVGSPRFMAPEQMRCAWRDYGPWTDLYALGCLGWAAATGEPPFGANPDPAEQALRRRDPPGAFRPRTQVPPGLEGWLRHLLELRIASRAQSAAVAAWHLAQMPVERAAPRGAFSTLSPFARSAPLPAPSPTEDGSPPSWGPPQLPDRWELPWDRAAASEPLGLGLGLLGLRQLRVVGRTHEQDALWDAFVDVSLTRRARAVFLHGPPGCGKTRLAEWLCERVSELGAGAVLTAWHGPVRGAGDGIGAMLARALRCDGLTREELPGRLAEVCADRLLGCPVDAGLLAALVAPAAAPSGSSEATEQVPTSHRYAAAAQLLRVLAGDQAAVLLLDDVQWGADALGLARHLLGLGGIDCPVVILMTSLSDRLPPGWPEKGLVDSIAGDPRTAVLRVGPLPETQRWELVREVLRLEPGLAAGLAERTDGNPAFAISLVGAWAQAGELNAGLQGYERRANGEDDLPRALDEVWRDRLARFVAERPEADRCALELAAVLGGRVDPTEWRAACEAAAAFASPRLVEELLATRIARAGPEGLAQGWALANGSLGALLTEQARVAGRLEGHHRACARALAPRASRGEAARVGHHLRLSGELDACLEPLLHGARDAIVAGEAVRAATCLTERDEAMNELRISDLDPRRARGWNLRAIVAMGQGDSAEAERWAARVTDVDGEGDWVRLQVVALLIRGRLAARRGDPTAEATLLLAQRRARQLGDHRHDADATLSLAHCHARQGVLDLAASGLDAARALYERIDCGLGVAQCITRRGYVDLQGGAVAEGAGRLRVARERYERLGAPRGVAETTLALGDAHRRLGDLEAAVECYAYGARQLRAFGSAEWLFADCNLALVDITRGSWQAAQDRLEAVLRGAERHGIGSLEAYTHTALVASAAGLGRWSRYDAHTKKAADLLHSLGAAEWDVMWLFGVAAGLARHAGQERRAERAEKLEEQQRRRLRVG